MTKEDRFAGERKPETVRDLEMLVTAVLYGVSSARERRLARALEEAIEKWYQP